MCGCRGGERAGTTRSNSGSLAKPQPEAKSKTAAKQCASVLALPLGDRARMSHRLASPVCLTCAASCRAWPRGQACAAPDAPCQPGPVGWASGPLATPAARRCRAARGKWNRCGCVGRWLGRSRRLHRLQHNTALRRRRSAAAAAAAAGAAGSGPWLQGSPRFGQKPGHRWLTAAGCRWPAGTDAAAASYQRQQPAD